MREKLIAIKDNLIVAKDGTKRFFAGAATLFKRFFLYTSNMMRFAVPFLLIETSSYLV